MKDTFKKILCDSQSISWFAYAVVSFSFILGFVLLLRSILGLELGNVAALYTCFCVIVVVRVVDHTVDHKYGVYVPNPRAACAYIFGLVLVAALFTVVNG